MPTYVYETIPQYEGDVPKRFEIRQSMKDDALTKHPDNGQPPRVYFAFQQGDSPEKWIGRITVPKFAAKGTWSIVWLQALDKSNNLKTYSAADPVLQNAKFNVH